MAGRQQVNMVDSSDEEGAHQVTAAAPELPPPESKRVSVGTQTSGSMTEFLSQFAERSFAVVDLKPIKLQFWDHFLSCMRMPRGGLSGGGSQHCEFEFVCHSEEIVQYLVEDLPLMRDRRYNLSLPPPHWEASPSISTYYAETHTLLDSYMRLHRREAAKGYRGYRGSVLAAAPGTYKSPVAMISACTPLLMELCQRKHSKLVLAVSFNLCVMNDASLLVPPRMMPYSVGMDAVLQRRCMNHLKRLQSRKESMSDAFGVLAGGWQSSLTDSEGEWVAPPSETRQLLGLPPPAGSESGSAEESDGEEVAAQAAASNVERPRAVGTRWEGKMRS